MNKRNCKLKGLWWVPQERCGNFEHIERHLTVNPKWYDRNEPRPDPIICTKVQGDYIGLPIAWGMQEYPDPDYLNLCSEGGVLEAPKRPDPNHPLASPGQAQFIEDLFKAMQEQHVALARAPTGSGKTVSFLSAAADNGRSTLLITDRTYLGFKQWIPQAMDKIGLTRDQIGIVQGKQCDYKKPFVVAIAKSLTENIYPKEFYSAFGLLGIDETHKFAAPTLAAIAPMFNPQTSVAMSATTERKDGLEIVFKRHFGEVSVQGTAKALPCHVKIVDYHDGGHARIPHGNHGVAVTILARLRDRNQIMVNEIKELYDDGRNILVIGDNIRHLQVLEEMCWRAGISDKATGQFTRERYYYETKHDTHKGKPAKIKIQKKSRVTDDYLEWVQKYARIIFATYGMMKEGTDIPRLDAGIDVTPRSEWEQVGGRVRRPMPGKRIPLWVTMRDTYHKGLMGYFNGRMDDIIKTGAKVIK